MQAKRVLFLVVALGLSLVPTTGRASIPMAQEGTPASADEMPTAVECPPTTGCDLFGRYLGPPEGIDGPNPDQEMQLYRFTFGPWFQMPEVTYEETLWVYVEAGTFTLTIQEGTIDAFLPSGREELGAGTYEVPQGTRLFHEGGTATYGYWNTSDDEAASLSVAVLDAPSTPSNCVFTCSWCDVMVMPVHLGTPPAATPLASVSGAQALTSAKRIPSLMCGGG